MIKSGIYLRTGDIIYPIEVPDYRAVVLRSNQWQVEILWDDGFIGKIEEKDLVNFNITGENIEYKVKELLALINFM
jgi:hypothetical protein